MPVGIKEIIIALLWPSEVIIKEWVGFSTHHHVFSSNGILSSSVGWVDLRRDIIITHTITLMAIGKNTARTLKDTAAAINALEVLSVATQWISISNNFMWMNGTWVVVADACWIRLPASTVTTSHQYCIIFLLWWFAVETCDIHLCSLSCAGVRVNITICGRGRRATVCCRCEYVRFINNLEKVVTPKFTTTWLHMLECRPCS